jgi:hypothetical protein
MISKTTTSLCHLSLRYSTRKELSVYYQYYVYNTT